MDIAPDYISNGAIGTEIQTFLIKAITQRKKVYDYEEDSTTGSLPLVYGL